jgi:hypothetical protein
MNRTMLLLAALLTAAPALAGDAPLLPPVQIAVTGFKAKLDAGRVILTWRRYKRDDFVSYAVVKSDKDSDPGYPGSPAVVTFAAAEGVRWEDGKLSPGTWNYRLVITTRFGDRWVSPVTAVVIGPGDVHRAPPGNSDFAD